MTPLRSGLRLRDGRLTLVAPITDNVWRALEGAPASAGPLQALRTREVALKFLPADAGGTAVLEREAEVTTRASHAGLLKVFGRYAEGGWTIVSMERCAFSMGDAVDKGGPLAPEDALAVVREASEALAVAHRAGIVHGAIKPRNVLLRDDGSIAVGDFGSAQALLDPNARVGAAGLLGAVPYLAPEVRADLRDASPASDVYALGVMLGTLALGSPPLDPYMPESAARIRAVLPDVLAEVLIGACAWSPTARPGDAGAMRLLLERARAAIGSMATLPRGRARWCTPEAPRPTPRPMLRALDGDAPPRGPEPSPIPLRSVIPLRRRGERIDEAAPHPDARAPGEPAPLVELPGTVQADAEPQRRAVLAYQSRAEADEAPSPPPEPPARTAPRRAGDWSLFALAGIAAIAAVVSAVGVVVRPSPDVPSAVEASAQAPAVGPLPWCHTAAGAFVGPTSPGPRETVAVAAQDLDADGSVDALYTNALDESVTIWWGRAGHSAGDRLDLPSGRSAVAPIAYDLDEDGVLDLLLPLPEDSAFGRLRGLGGRMFGAVERIPQSPAPRAAWVVDAREGPTVLFVAGTRLWARPLANGQLGEARPLFDGVSAEKVTLATIGPDLWLALAGAQARLLRLDADLVVRQQVEPAAWPELATVFASDLDGAPGQELYGITPLGQAVRLPTRDGDLPCAATPAGALQPTSVLARLDADDIPDAVQADSCAQCTSSHAFTFGQPAR